MRLTQLHKDSIMRCVANDIPALDEIKVRQDIATAIEKAMSPAVRRLYKTNPTALRTVDISWYDIGCNRSYSALVVGDVSKDALTEILKPYKDARSKQRDVLLQLKYALKGVTTLASAKKLLPEFISYFPTDEEPTKNLPAVTNIMADLSKMGWPKGAKK